MNVIFSLLFHMFDINYNIEKLYIVDYSVYGIRIDENLILTPQIYSE